MVFRVSCPEAGYQGTELSECAAAAPRAHSRSLLHHDNAVDLWQGDEQELVILDERIHRAIDRCAHNQLLETMLVQCYVLALRIRRLALDRSREFKSTAEHHCQLFQALSDGRSEDACMLMLAAVRDMSRRCGPRSCWWDRAGGPRLPDRPFERCGELWSVP